MNAPNFGQSRSRRGWALQLLTSLNDDPFHDTQPSWERSSQPVSQMRFHSRQEATDGRSNSRRWGPIPLVPQRRADATFVCFRQTVVHEVHRNLKHGEPTVPVPFIITKVQCTRVSSPVHPLPPDSVPATCPRFVETPSQRERYLLCLIGNTYL